MNLESSLGTLRLTTRLVAGFAALAMLAGLAQVALGGIAVSHEYDRIEAHEREVREQMESYGYTYRQTQMDHEYSRSSSAFFMQGRFLAGSDDADPNWPAIASALALVLAALGFTISAMIWVWRAHKNLWQLGIRTKYSPAMAVAAFFIPLANLVLPFEIMRELYNRSEGAEDELAFSSVEDVTAWFTALIVGLLIFSAMLVKLVLDAGTALIIMTPLWMEFGIIAFAILLLTGSTLLFAKLTSAITQSQELYLPQVDPQELQERQPERPRVKLIG